MSPLKEITPNKIKTLDKLRCDYCKLVFDCEPALQAHAQEHEGPVNRCRLCDSSFSSKWNLRRHIERLHGLRGERETPGVKIMEVSSEEEHEEEEEGDTKENKSKMTATCDICNKGFRGRFVNRFTENI